MNEGIRFPTGIPCVTGLLVAAGLMTFSPSLAAQVGATVRVAVELQEGADLSLESLREGLALVVEGEGLDADQPVFDDGEGLILFALEVEDGKVEGLWRSRRVGPLRVGRTAWDPDDLPGGALAEALAEARPVRGEVPWISAERLMASMSRERNDSPSVLAEALAGATGDRPESFVALVIVPMEPDSLEGTAIRPLFGVTR